MKTVVITGASSGIGLVVARDLARAGWRVIAHGRDPARAAAALAQIRAAAPGAQVDMLLAELSTMAEVDRLADQVLAMTDRIDVLANNAGFIPATRVETADGLEQCFAANHLAPFVLTNRLLPLLRAAGPGAQVINTASVAHRFVKDMLWDDLQQTVRFSAGNAYAQSKLANILHARALARRVAGDGIRVNAMHPGLVGSNFPAHGNWLTKAMYGLTKPFQLTPEQGADTILWLAKGGGGDVTGEYFVKRKVTGTTPAAQSRDGAERLWAISEGLHFSG
jgi:NAD(P)-dependent dehydrogenase (short-subunit alcohol dehydrogenase family)